MASRFDVNPDVRAIGGMVDEYAEFSVIAHLIQSPTNARAILENVFSEMFTTVKRGQIVEAITTLVTSGSEITPSSVLIEARRNAIRLGEQCEVEEEDLAKAKKYRADDLSGSISLVSSVYRNRRYMTEVVLWGAEILGSSRADEFAREIKDRVDSIILPPRTYSEIMRGADVAGLTTLDQERITSRWDSGMMADLSWPWASMADAPLILPGWFAIFAGRDGGMKTAFVESYFEAMCRRESFGRIPRCLYVHTEYGPEMMRQRRLARWSGVPLDRLLRGNTTPADRLRVGEAIEKMRSFPGMENIDYLHYTPKMTAQDVLNYAMLAHKRGEVDIIAVDYFNNIKMPPAILREAGGEVNKALGEVARLFQAFSAEETGVPIIMIGQLTKEGMKVDEGGKSASPSGISGPAAWMQRAQLQMLASRPILMYDGQDVIVERSGEKVKCGVSGRRSSILDITFAKATVGGDGLYQLRAYPSRYMVGSLQPGSMRL